MPGGSRDHADIAMFGRGEIYEVKPDTEDWIRQGRDQVDRYLQQLNKARVRMPEYRPGTRWLKGKDPGAGITGIRAWEPGRAFRSFHMDYKGHRILVRYAGHGVVTYGQSVVMIVMTLHMRTWKSQRAGTLSPHRSGG